LLATGCDGLGSTGSLSHFIYMFIHLYVWFLCKKNSSSSSSLKHNVYDDGGLDRLVAVYYQTYCYISLSLTDIPVLRTVHTRHIAVRHTIMHA